MKHGSIKWGFDKRIGYDHGGKHRLNPARLSGYDVAAVTQQWPMDLVNVSGEIDGHLDRDVLILETFEGGHIYFTVRLPRGYRCPTLACRNGKYIRNVNLIAFCDTSAVIQVLHGMERTDFLFLEKFEREGYDFRCKAIYTHYGVTPFLMEAYISPDASRILLKPSHNYGLLSNTIPDDDTVEVIHVHEKRGKLSKIIFEGEAMVCTFAFDPRYFWRRLVVGSETGHRKTLTLYDLAQKKVLCESDPSIQQMTQNLLFSRDGFYIASLIVDSKFYGDALILEGVLIYDSETLSILHSIPSPYKHTECQTVPIGLFPLFSDNGHCIAAPVVLAHRYINEDDTYPKLHIQIYNVPTSNKFGLQDLCKLSILKAVRKHKIPNLPIPTRVKDFLLGKPYLS